MTDDKPTIAEYYAEKKREQRRLTRKLGRLLNEHRREVSND